MEAKNDLRHIAPQSASFHRVIRLRLSDKVMQFVMRLQFNAEGVVRFIAQGWRQPTLGYACSEEVNAVGVVRFLRGMSR